MINVVIIEDEAPARRKLIRFLEEVGEEVAVVAELTTVIDAIQYLSTSKNIDLILSDIELLDGNVFEIYSSIKISVPIIFTTAYNQFLMEAFETNGIEYLLKPFSQERFRKAWAKFIMFSPQKSQEDDLLKKIGVLLKSHSLPKGGFKSRFAVTSHHATFFIDVDRILFFTAEEGVVVAIDTLGKKHVLTCSTLKEIENVVDPLQFFRINRSELINKVFVERIERYSKNSISVRMQGYSPHLVTSQSTTASFREWIEG